MLSWGDWNVIFAAAADDQTGVGEIEAEFRPGGGGGGGREC